MTGKTAIVFFLLALCWTVNAHKRLPQQEVHMENMRWAEDSSILMSVTPTLLTTPTGWVTVSWSGVADPKSDDWIGVFSPSTVNFYTTTPIKYQYAQVSPNYLTTGSGSLSFQLINMHSNVVFVFMRNGTSYPDYAAKTPIVDFSNYNYPMQGHLAVTKNAGEMRVSWAIGVTEMSQYVEYGTKSGSYSKTVTATSSTYTASDLCGSPATGYGWKAPGYLQTAVLSGLSANTRYYYRYGSNQSGWSDEYHFVSAPKTGASVGVSLIAFGDMGKGEVDGSVEHWEEQPSLNTTQNMVSLVSSGSMDLVLHIGDISYAVGYASQWDEFMQQILPVATAVPYMTCIGNHERDYPHSGCYYNGTDSGGECGVPYEARFIMPGTENAPDEPWYSFDYGNVHFLLMSTEHNFQIGSDQYNWIESDLASVDRTITPWVIFGGHRPMYIDSTNSGGYTSDQQVAALMRLNLEPLLLKYKVNLALWGHNHSYQRTCPVYNLTCQAGAPTHVVIGMAGYGLTQLLQNPQPSYFVFTDDQEYGYTTITTTQSTLTMQFYNNDNQLRDEFSLSNTQEDASYNVVIN